VNENHLLKKIIEDIANKDAFHNARDRDSAFLKGSKLRSLTSENK